LSRGTLSHQLTPAISLARWALPSRTPRPARESGLLLP
jgi:hypothetical protein